MKIAQLKEEIVAAKLEIDRISKRQAEIEKSSNRKVEGGVENKVSEKRKKIEFPVESEIEKSSNRKVEGGAENKLSDKRKKIEDYYNYCLTCDVKAYNSRVWQSHLNGKRHRENKLEQGDREIVFHNCSFVGNWPYPYFH